MSNILLETQNISKSFGDKKALQNFNIKIPEGSIYGLLGPNGAGKTTFLRIINQISFPDTGKILFNGETLQQKHIAQIGYMPEERGLYRNMKVGEQAIYLAQLKGLEKAEATKRLKLWFEKLQIKGWWDKKINELSKGMGQKVQFITTVLHEPKLIIFDEPFSGFDPVNANIIRDEILQLKAKGTTIIFSTHRMESVEEMCDYVALINKSEKILDGEINDIKQQFKEGKLKVKLKVNNAELFSDFKQQYDIIELKTNKDVADFVLNTTQNTTKKVINEINKLGELIYFNEMTPSMNEIFLKAVKE
ncbi:MAG: ATP-binding cassette domain-containing protein [Bacteroidetes bacterium]|nr:ATP-binding cassette domain-containing protein [Bacteroidota bacterium]MCB9226240.1 ABC transporter ATP-binding protein [Chitinophagales bacterium]